MIENYCEAQNSQPLNNSQGHKIETPLDVDKHWGQMTSKRSKDSLSQVLLFINLL